ncbi:MAG: ATP-dependent nuclease [Acidobacteriaceae bacterium]
MYGYDSTPNTVFSSSSQSLLQQIKNAEYAVLVGRNNCGKSYILKNLTQQMGQNASYLGPARYQNFNLLSFFTPNRSRKQQKYNEFMNYWRQQQNMDNSPVNLQQAIAELSDDQRETLREIVKLLLGTDIEILQTVPNNSMSQKYISAGGHNLSFSSSGFRLITTLITSLLDRDYDTFLIDEPELGISPEAQGILADFLFDRAHRAKYFAHIKTLIFATHSTIFLDRRNISNNFIVEKNGDEISLKQTATQQDFNRIHFFLLGNRFETLYLPSLIILVEGKSDHAFIQRVLTTRFPNQQFSIINANCDNRLAEILNIAKNLLTDIQRSPYRERIIAVLDSVHSQGLRERLISMGMLAENIVKWEKNGIEYSYPPTLLDQVYGVGGQIEIGGDVVIRNGLRYTKAALSGKICELVDPTTAMSEEFEERFLSLVKRRTE